MPYCTLSSLNLRFREIVIGKRFMINTAHFGRQIVKFRELSWYKKIDIYNVIDIYIM